MLIIRASVAQPTPPQLLYFLPLRRQFGRRLGLGTEDPANSLSCELLPFEMTMINSTRLHVAPPATILMMALGVSLPNPITYEFAAIPTQIVRSIGVAPFYFRCISTASG
ncbi:MAG TPA: hypothetical protein VLC46_00085 [Thermoanaerobaculia bacterium]|nr:hypothetical protein [Thermoanaerobaculia bacterium]